MWAALHRPIRRGTTLQRVHDMTLATESHVAGKPSLEKPRSRPARTGLWFVIVAVLMAAVFGAAIYFDHWRANFIKDILSKKPPPNPVSVAEAKSEVIP